jgi:restriction system protein
MYSVILQEVGRQEARGEVPRFVKHGRGIVGLSAWLPRGLAADIADHNRRVREELLERIQSDPPDAFQNLVGELLAALGFEDVEVTGRSGDGGIDVRGTLVVGEDVRIRMAVQAKRWRNNVQSPTVQQVRGALGAHDQGLIITTSDFSKGAVDEASLPDRAPVALMNGEQLLALLAEHQIGVRRERYDLFTLDSPGETDS